MLAQSKGKPSFFDSEHTSQIIKIWEPLVNPPLDIILDTLVFKHSRTTAGRKPIRLLLTNEHIYLMKSETLRGQLSLVLTKMEILEGGFRLTRNQQTLQFHIDDPTAFLEWKSQLVYKCFQATFHEDFQVSKMIGKGSFAKVYLATKKETNTEYAIKAFNKEFMLEQFKGKESLENEIKVMRRFKQESLVHLYEVYETVNSIYFVIDILRGGELLNRVKQKGMLHQTDLQQLMFNFTKALAYIHKKNCVHRDLKPENLLLKSKDHDWDVVIADFGLATFLDEEILFKRCGTPGFVAPEILNYKDGDKFYDQKCDVFSAGIIFYVLLTGKQPFQGADYKIILRANKSCEINFNLPQIVNSPLPLQDLLKKMLIADPLRRPTSMECLMHEYFAQLAMGESLPAFQNTQENMIMYEKDYLYGLSKKVQDSHEYVGSMELQHRVPAVNGKIDTIGSLSNYSTSIPRFDQKLAPGASKFSQFSQRVGSQQSVESSSPSNRHHKNQEDLHKKALKNSLFNKHQQEESKRLEEDVNEENPGLQQAMNKFKEKEGQIKLFKSFSHNSPSTSPKNANK